MAKEREGTFSTRNVAGTGLEVAGAVVAIAELAELDLTGGLVGGLIWLLGSWIKNYGK